MITSYDYLNIGFYFAFIIGVGVYFSRKSKDTSDYFRGGGVMPWWVTGASAWMAGFSAWSFTGASGKIYENGPYVLVLYFQSVIPLLVLLAFTCYRFRRLRVVTPMEAVRLRFGACTQQFYTWLRLPVLLVFSALTMNAVGVFMSAVFGFDITTVIIGLGVVVTFISLFGGALGVAASDFVQMLLIVAVVLVIVVLTLMHPAIGGIEGLIRQAPSKHFNWGEIAQPNFIGFWFLGLTLNTIFKFNSLSDSVASKYMMAQSDRHARLMVSIPLIGTIVGSWMLWIIPPMAAAILHPNLAVEFPQLRFPNEAAFLATACDVLPQGMLGLLICGIFAASLTDMSGNLNWGAGLIMRNFYLPVVNPACPEAKLMRLSRLSAMGLGLLLILFALALSRYRTLGLFDLVNQVGISLELPLSIPLCIGMFYKRTPGWSAWSTAFVGLAASYLARFWLKPGMVSWIPGIRGPLNAEETNLFYIFATVAVVTAVCVGWFFFTTRFYEKTSDTFKAGVEEFFQRLRTPVTQAASGIEENRNFSGGIGRLCLIYGGFVVLLTAIPNSFNGRLCFLAAGGFILGIGLLLVWRHRRQISH